MTAVLHVTPDLSLCAGLARAQARAGMRVRVVTPLRDTAGLARRITPLKLDGADVTVWEGTLPGGRVPVYHVDAPEADALRTAVDAARAMGFAPQIVHAHDVAAAAALATARPAATVVTLHHPPSGGELPAADRITAPSPRAALGLAGVVGLLGGVDTDVWNPGADPLLPEHFGHASLAGKQGVKTSLQHEVGLPVRAHAPLFAAIGLTVEGGAALLVEAGGELATLDAQLLILGRGERRFDEPLSALARRFPNRVAFSADAGEALVHRATAGADFLLAPALADPAGTPAMIALRFGTLPIATAVGGLDDVVVDYDPDSRTGSGIKLAEASPAALVAAVKRALALHHDQKTLARLSARAMEFDFSWDAAARRHAELYAKLMEAPKS
jgi:glycogen synthase